MNQVRVAPVQPRRRFCVVLIKPSHYHDDGYVIRWWRGLVPSNSLAALHGVALDCAQRHVLGPDVDIDIDVIDETNTRVNVPKLLRRFRNCSGYGIVALVGVQTNQYPRALDIARPFRQAGISVVIGGFHVSGCIAMLDGKAVDLDRARDLGVSIFAGEAEGRFEELLQDAAGGCIRPQYDFTKDLVDMTGQPSPFLPIEYVRRTAGTNSSFDSGRGCPFQCSFCTIINVQGRKSRSRTPDDVEQVIRENWEEGISRFFLTDDNFARNREWEPILDRLIKLREVDGIPLGLMIQVDTLCHRIPKFIEKCARAGVTRVFIGLENINPDNLKAVKKPQNKITEYRRMLLAWKAQGIFTYAGYILGLPADTAESIRRDIEIIQRELPLDIVEWVILTPLPGSEDHRSMWRDGVAMDGDLNNYDFEHVVAEHPRMSRAEWQAIYQEAWTSYYSRDHVETLLRRGAASGVSLLSLVKALVPFIHNVPVENIHPLQAGLFRRKHRSERRYGLPRESLWAFYSSHIANTIVNNWKLAGTVFWILRLKRRIERDPRHLSYTDVALTAVVDDDVEATLDLLTKTAGAKAAIDHIKKVAALTH
ncbi:MAG TPA: radical SAM protein [Xanthobacteraceae bacterium]|nr:radical SAM protein [Xanthobacteraceae bacterium]